MPLPGINIRTGAISKSIREPFSPPPLSADSSGEIQRAQRRCFAGSVEISTLLNLSL